MRMIVYSVFVFMLFFLSLPLQCAMVIALAMTEGFPVFFAQSRVGKNGRHFILYKFRTMYPGSEERQKKLVLQNEASGPVFKIHDDPRYTGIGRFLAHTGLDELPQLWNVVRGDMALIGPRPLPVSEAKELIAWQQKRHDIKPGIISPWIIEGYHRQTFDAWMKSDIAYTAQKTMAYDLQLAYRTLLLLGHLFLREVLKKRNTTKIL